MDACNSNSRRQGLTAKRVNVDPADTDQRERIEINGTIYRLTHKCVQWSFLVAEGGNNYALVNLGPNLELLYYLVLSGKYGEPLSDAEPFFGFDVPQNVKYVNPEGQATEPSFRITGIICRDKNRRILKGASGKRLRFGLSNCALFMKLDFQLNDEAVFEIDGQVLYLQALCLQDKQRTKGYDAFFGPEKPKAVVIFELEEAEIPWPTDLPVAA